jgi:hypothetical protein
VRAGVAAVLNGASACVQYPMCLDEVIARVDAALASCDRRILAGVADVLEGQNALGCPLDQRGVCANRRRARRSPSAASSTRARPARFAWEDRRR